MTAAVCSVNGCRRPIVALGYCEMHYVRVRRWGSPLVVGRRGRPKGSRSRYGTVFCTVVGCFKPHKSKGMCAAHLSVWWRQTKRLPARRKIRRRK